MALVTLTITADTTAAPQLVPVLVAAAQEWMDSQTPKIDYSGMTQAQKVTRYIKGLMMSVYVSRTTGSVKTTVDATVETARLQAILDANNGIS